MPHDKGMRFVQLTWTCVLSKSQGLALCPNYRDLKMPMLLGLGLRPFYIDLDYAHISGAWLCPYSRDLICPNCRVLLYAIYNFPSNGDYEL